MTKLDPDAKAPPWPHKQTWERVMACAAMLNLHDFMSDGERRKVNARINAWLKANKHRMAWDGGSRG